MVRIFIIALFTVLLISSDINGSSKAYAAYADPHASSEGEWDGISYDGTAEAGALGFNAKIDAALNNRSQALVVQAKAYYNEVVRRPESVLDMSCFSDSMTNFAQLGRQFSDVKFNFNFNFAGNPLCAALTFEMDTSLKGDLQTFFKVPGLEIPDLEVCSPNIDIGAKITSKIQAFLGESLPVGDLAEGKNLLGCPINSGLKIGGNLVVEPMCARVQLPLMDCNTMTNLVMKDSKKLFKDLTGIDLGSDLNAGWAYLTVTDQGNIGTGVDVDMAYVLDALSDTNPEFAQAMADIKEGIGKLKEIHEAYLNLLGGSFEAGVSLEGSTSGAGSGDGLTSNGKMGMSAGHRSSAGTGQEFSYQFSDINGETQEKLKENIIAIQQGPGSPEGLESWRLIPHINETITLQNVFDFIKDSGNEDEQ